VETLWRLLLWLAFGPAIVFVGLHMLVAVLAAVMPWLLILSVVAGITAGTTAALMLRRRLPPPQDRDQILPRGFPLGPYRQRRPRGRDWR